MVDVTIGTPFIGDRRRERSMSRSGKGKRMRNIVGRGQSRSVDG